MEQTSTATRKVIKQRHPTFPPSMDAFFHELSKIIDSPSGEAETAVASLFKDTIPKVHVRNKSLRIDKIAKALRLHPIWEDLLGGPISILPQYKTASTSIRDFHLKQLKLLAKLAALTYDVYERNKQVGKDTTLDNLVNPAVGSQLEAALTDAIKAIGPIRKLTNISEKTENALKVYNLLCVFGGYRSSVFSCALYYTEELQNDDQIGPPTFKSVLNYLITEYEWNALLRAQCKVNCRPLPKTTLKNGPKGKRVKGDPSQSSQVVRAMLNAAGTAQATEFSTWPLPVGHVQGVNGNFFRIFVDVYGALVNHLLAEQNLASDKNALNIPGKATIWCPDAPRRKGETANLLIYSPDLTKERNNVQTLHKYRNHPDKLRRKIIRQKKNQKIIRRKNNPEVKINYPLALVAQLLTVLWLDHITTKVDPDPKRKIVDGRMGYRHLLQKCSTYFIEQYIS